MDLTFADRARTKVWRYEDDFDDDVKQGLPIKHCDLLSPMDLTLADEVLSNGLTYEHMKITFMVE